MAPNPNNTKEESLGKVIVVLQYNREWEATYGSVVGFSEKFSGWSFTTLEEEFTGKKIVDRPQKLVSLFELETTGNFKQRFDLYYLMFQRLIRWLLVRNGLGNIPSKNLRLKQPSRFSMTEEEFTGKKIVDRPQKLVSIFELETTGNFKQRFDLD